jgi:DNA-binding NarL/FixJ family response regulator
MGCRVGALYTKAAPPVPAFAADVTCIYHGFNGLRPRAGRALAAWHMECLILPGNYLKESDSEVMGAKLEALVGDGQEEFHKRSVLLVDDHPVVCEGLALRISREPDFAVCGTAKTAGGAMAAIARFNPSLVVLDLELPNCHGLEVLQDIRANYPQLPVLVFSMHEEADYAERSLRAGARGYLMKHESSECLLEGMRTVLDGGCCLSRAASARVVQGLAGPDNGPAGSSAAGMCNRELEVFQFIGQGKGTREIAGLLGLSVKTIETYRERIKKKLHVKGSPELTRRAVCWVETGN